MYYFVSQNGKNGVTKIALAAKAAMFFCNIFGVCVNEE
jgi:hypothetical protein